MIEGLSDAAITKELTVLMNSTGWKMLMDFIDRNDIKLLEQRLLMGHDDSETDEQLRYKLGIYYDLKGMPEKIIKDMTVTPEKNLDPYYSAEEIEKEKRL